MHLLFLVLLKVQLLLELIELSPKLSLIVLYVHSIALKGLNLAKLLLLLCIDPRQVLIELSQFLFQSLTLFRFLNCIIPFQLRAFQLQILLKLLELLAVSSPLLLLLNNLIIKLVQDLIKAIEADWVLDLQATLL